MALAVVRDLRSVRAEPSPEDIAEFETDALAGFVLARASAGLADATIRGDVGHLEDGEEVFGPTDLLAVLTDRLRRGSLTTIRVGRRVYEHGPREFAAAARRLAPRRATSTGS